MPDPSPTRARRSIDAAPPNDLNLPDGWTPERIAATEAYDRELRAEVEDMDRRDARGMVAAALVVPLVVAGWLVAQLLDRGAPWWAVVLAGAIAVPSVALPLWWFWRWAQQPPRGPRPAGDRGVPRLRSRRAQRIARRRARRRP